MAATVAIAVVRFFEARFFFQQQPERPEQHLQRLSLSSFRSIDRVAYLITLCVYAAAVGLECRFNRKRRSWMFIDR